VCGRCLNGDGASANDADDSDSGGNNRQNHPDLATAVVEYGALTVGGSLPHDTSQGAALDLAFYASPGCGVPGAGAGFFLGDQIAQFPIGELEFSLSLTLEVAVGAGIAASASSLVNGNVPANTSELSTCIPVTLGDGIFKNAFES